MSHFPGSDEPQCGMAFPYIFIYAIQKNCGVMDHLILHGNII